MHSELDLSQLKDSLGFTGDLTTLNGLSHIISKNPSCLEGPVVCIDLDDTLLLSGKAQDKLNDNIKKILLEAGLEPIDLDEKLSKIKKSSFCSDREQTHLYSFTEHKRKIKELIDVLCNNEAKRNSLYSLVDNEFEEYIFNRERFEYLIEALKELKRRYIFSCVIFTFGEPNYQMLKMMNLRDIISLFDQLWLSHTSKNIFISNLINNMHMPIRKLIIIDDNPEELQGLLGIKKELEINNIQLYLFRFLTMHSKRSSIFTPIGVDEIRTVVTDDSLKNKTVIINAIRNLLLS